MVRHVKIYARIPSGSTKPLPKKWNWLLRLFYNIIDSKNETDIYINLEILRYTINRLNEKRINRLVKAFKQLEKWITTKNNNVSINLLIISIFYCLSKGYSEEETADILGTTRGKVQYNKRKYIKEIKKQEVLRKLQL